MSKQNRRTQIVGHIQALCRVSLCIYLVSLGSTYLCWNEMIFGIFGLSCLTELDQVSCRVKCRALQVSSLRVYIIDATITTLAQIDRLRYQCILPNSRRLHAFHCRILSGANNLRHVLSWVYISFFDGIHRLRSCTSLLSHTDMDFAKYKSLQ